MYAAFEIYKQDDNTKKPRIPSGAYLSAMLPIWSNYFHAGVEGSESGGLAATMMYTWV